MLLLPFLSLGFAFAPLAAPGSAAGPIDLPPFRQVGPNPAPQQGATLPIPRRHTVPSSDLAGAVGNGGNVDLTTAGKGQPDKLAECLGRGQRDPAAGLAFARGWLAEGATPAARVRANQCLGLLQADAGDFAAAEAAFADAIAGIPPAQVASGVPLLAMAGNAALAEGKPKEALHWLDMVLAVKDYDDRPALGAIQTDRARALVALGNIAAANGALEQARAMAPNDPSPWLLSATLARRAKDLATARREIETAALLDPKDPAIGLEAGVIEVLGGHDEAARRSWQSVLALAPDSAEAKTARGYIEQLGLEQPGPVPTSGARHPPE